MAHASVLSPVVTALSLLTSSGPVFDEQHKDPSPYEYPGELLAWLQNMFSLAGGRVS